jgi:hypothetical protein
LRDWARRAWADALPRLSDPAYAHWWRCKGKWFAGVDVLDNDCAGRVGASAPLTAILRGAGLPQAPLHKAQVSVVRPGYPQPWDGETDTAFRYRLRRDAAHVDGLLPIGAARRRMLREPHAYILGLPLNDTGPGASPLVVWEGSHKIVGAAFRAALGAHPADTWADVDLTEVYHAARRTCFDTCRRVELHARPGQAYLVHRAALHGIAPWTPGAAAPPEGRMIAYFRPQTTLQDWLGT